MTILKRKFRVLYGISRGDDGEFNDFTVKNPTGKKWLPGLHFRSGKKRDLAVKLQIIYRGFCLETQATLKGKHFGNFQCLPFYCW
jgi:hypothetical protein